LNYAFKLGIKKINKFVGLLYYREKEKNILMRNWKTIYTIILTIFLTGCQTVKPTNPNFQKDAAKSEYIHRSMKKLTDVIVHDIISPPVASRDYAYPSIAAYEALQNGYEDYQTLAGQLNGLSPIPAPDANQEYCFPLASVHAFLTAGKEFIFSGYEMEDFQQELYAEMDSSVNMPKDVYDRSIAYGESVAAHILAWSKKDNYAEIRSAPK